MAMNETADGEPTFEQSLLDLERIVNELEDGQTGLEQSLTLYEKGVHLIQRCHGQLRVAEQRIVTLTGVDEDGQAVIQVFQHSATAEVAKPESKRPRKKAGDPEIPF
jgi:exodeoxyribonuclease VII small subunit